MVTCHWLVFICGTLNDSVCSGQSLQGQQAAKQNTNHPPLAHILRQLTIFVSSFCDFFAILSRE